MISDMAIQSQLNFHVLYEIMHLTGLLLDYIPLARYVKYAVQKRYID
jgi:hypothetical protein